MSDKTLSYKGYLGSVEMSLDDACLYGEVLFVNDLVSYEGKTVEELQKAFVEAVDHYLAKCEEEGLESDKPCSGTFNVRFTAELHRAACLEAAKHGRSLNDFVKEAVTLAVSVAKTVINETHHHTHIQRVEIISEQGPYEIAKSTWQNVSENRPRKGQLN